MCQPRMWQRPLSWPLAWHEEPLPLREDEEHLPWHEESESLREEHLPWHEETLPLYEQEEHWLPSVDKGVDKGEAYVDLLDEDYVDPLDNFHDSLPPREELYELLSHPAHHNGEEPLYIFSGHELLDHSTQHNAQAIQHDEVENDEDASDHEATPVPSSSASAKQVKRKRMPRLPGEATNIHDFKSVDIFGHYFDQYLVVNGTWRINVKSQGETIAIAFDNTPYDNAYQMLYTALYAESPPGSNTYRGPKEFSAHSSIDGVKLGQLVETAFHSFVNGTPQPTSLYFLPGLKSDPVYQKFSSVKRSSTGTRKNIISRR